jgi:hypothetical protein
MKHCIVDVDGVLLNWFEPFLKYYKLTKDEFLLLDQDDPVAANHMIELFNKSAAMSQLPSYPDNCIWGMNRLYEHGYHITAITAFGGDKYSQIARTENLAKFFTSPTGQTLIRNIYFCPICCDKRSRLAKFGENSGIPFIEDHRKHARTGVQMGFNSFLLKRSYNGVEQKTAEDDAIIEVDDWKAIVKELT